LGLFVCSGLQWFDVNLRVFASCVVFFGGFWRAKVFVYALEVDYGFIKANRLNLKIAAMCNLPNMGAQNVGDPSCSGRKVVKKDEAKRPITIMLEPQILENLI